MDISEIVEFFQIIFKMDDFNLKRMYCNNLNKDLRVHFPYHSEYSTKHKESHRIDFIILRTCIVGVFMRYSYQYTRLFIKYPCSLHSIQQFTRIGILLTFSLNI